MRWKVDLNLRDGMVHLFWAEILEFLRRDFDNSNEYLHHYLSKTVPLWCGIESVFWDSLRENTDSPKSSKPFSQYLVTAIKKNLLPSKELGRCEKPSWSPQPGGSSVSYFLAAPGRFLWHTKDPCYKGLYDESTSLWKIATKWRLPITWKITIITPAVTPVCWQSGWSPWKALQEGPVY